MALKDWKKIVNRKTGVIYDHKTKKDKSVDIFKIKKEGIWEVYTNKRISRNFKTKSKALKFARSYMRKH